MPYKITTTNVLQITVQDTENNKQSFNIENPRTDTTIAQIRDIFAPIINSGKWYSRKGNQINYIAQGTLTKTKKIELGDSSPITVTPDSLEIPGGTQTSTVTVTGSPIVGYRIENESNRILIKDVKIDYINNSITVETSAASGFEAMAELIIITIASNITVPIICH